jgi:hypothetical protein
MESGIDNCVSVSASALGSSLQWTITGKENTLDHFTVYISEDGQNLMDLGEPDPALRSLNLCSYSLALRPYTLYVQAVGKPSLANHMSKAVLYTPSCGGEVHSRKPPRQHLR